MTYDLSIIIPARNEFFGEVDLLGETVRNVLANTSDKTQIIVINDGSWPLRPLDSNARVTVLHHNKSIGQRAACNEGVRVSSAKYICKLDAHCAVGPEFDTKMIAACDYSTTLIPVQYNLHAFSWKCKACKREAYQGPKPDKCAKCQSQYLKQVVKWVPRGWKERDGVWEGRPKTTSWRFDSTLHFQYWGEFANRPEVKALQPLTPTMSCLGACWFLHRERYWELDGMDEKHGSWGQMGTELACKTWLSGGQMLVNHSTWFAHLFRTNSGPLGTLQNFSFPYPNPGGDRAKSRTRELWMNNAWPKQVRPLSWLIEKFKPLPDWHTIANNPVLVQVNAAGEEFYEKRGLKPEPVTAVTVSTKPTKGILYYTCNSHDETLELAARNNLLKSKNGHELGCVSRERTLFGDWNTVIDLPKSAATMHEQILAGLERMKAEYVFLCESDVLYHQSHFDFVPPRNDVYYYNTNVWRVRYEDGHAVRTDDCKQVSGICCSRRLLLEHYRKRVERIRKEGFSRKNGFEPGTRGLPWGYDDHRAEGWQSEFPNIDITAHGQTLTTPKFSIDDFRNKKYAAGWQETDEPLPGWPKLAGRIPEFLAELANGGTVS